MKFGIKIKGRPVIERLGKLKTMKFNKKMERDPRREVKLQACTYCWNKINDGDKYVEYDEGRYFYSYFVHLKCYKKMLKSCMPYLKHHLKKYKRFVK